VPFAPLPRGCADALHLAAEEMSWFAKRGVLPVNHMVVVSKDLSRNHPDIVREVHRMLQASRAAAVDKVMSSSVDEMSRSIALITQYAAEQGLIPRAYAVDELFDDVTRGLR
jgi:4,5-dihydroxyphthalate decarboxylase